jgi:hypothetical protein
MKGLTKILRRQGGQALPMALVLLTIGAMVIVPTLILTRTNLNATKIVDQHTRELYAADAGIEDALWHLQSEARVKLINPTDTWPYNYNLDENVNLKQVQVSIDLAWLLAGLPNHSLPTDEPPELPPGVIGINANNNWTVTGAINIENTDNYIVDIATNETITSYVDHIGVWLPHGYSYVNNSVKINGVQIGGPGTNYSLVKNPDKIVVNGVEQYEQPFRGGSVLIWNYVGYNTTFVDLSDIALTPPSGQTPNEKFPPSIRLSFDYAVTPFREARGFFPWINLSTGNRVAWDTEAGFYHVLSTSITSETEQTTVEAYVPRGVVRYVSGSSGASSAIQGDYIAIGNSLMTCCWKQDKTGPPATGQNCDATACSTCCTNNPYRNYAPAPQIFTLAAGYPDGERESYATVGSSGVSPDVPSDAKIERAYLYWTAWLRGDKVWEESTLPQHGPGSWKWSSCMDTGSDHPTYWENCSLQTNPTVAAVKAWLAANAYDGKAYLAVDNQKVTPVNASDPLGTVVADTWYISEGSSDCNPSYQYSCFADVTEQVKAIRTALPGAKFTVAGVHAHPSIPTPTCTTNTPTITWSRSPNAGWSMVIIYSSAQKKTHQIYLYEGCEHLFNNGFAKELIITGFAAPTELESGETNEAKMTVFASEGDANPPNGQEYLGFKGQSTAYNQLYDVSGTADVFNSLSSAGGFTPSPISACGAATEISGIDIDTYTTTIATEPPAGIPLYTLVHPGDISASIKAQSTGDGFEIIYVVFSVRSTAIPAGAEFNVGTMLYRIQ